MEQFKVIIAGGRDFNDSQMLNNKVHNLLKEKINTHEVIVVCGCAKGADTLGAEWANNNEIKVKEFPADWDKHGKPAGYIRNKEMGDYADALIAFWDGESKGTKYMINIMCEMNKPCRIVRY